MVRYLNLFNMPIISRVIIPLVYVYSGLGFWGIWETASPGSHFELQKGGVFQAVPVFADTANAVLNL
jgi:hypothetical protein